MQSVNDIVGIARILERPADAALYGRMLQELKSRVHAKFRNVDVPSRIHTCDAGIASWFTKSVAGVRQDPAKPGYQSFLIQPVPGGKLTFAETTTESPYGPIASRWEKNRGVLKLIVTIPPNSTAAVHIPTTNAASLTEGGKSLRETDGVTPLEVEGGHAVLKVDSGRYEFLSEIR